MITLSLVSYRLKVLHLKVVEVHAFGISSARSTLVFLIFILCKYMSDLLLIELKKNLFSILLHADAIVNGDNGNNGTEAYYKYKVILSCLTFLFS